MPRDFDPSAKQPIDTSRRDVEIVPLDPPFDVDDEFLSEDVAASSTGVEEAGADPAATVPSLSLVHAEASTSPATLSISELLASGVKIDCQEAVAIVRRVCDALARHPSSSAHLLEPRHIAITARGDVQVYPGAPGSDSLVKQLGRILRALLEAGSAPAALRLLASQPSLELSGFENVRDLSEALRSYDAPQQTEAIKTVFKRGREAKSPYPPAPEPAPESRSIEMAPTAQAVAGQGIVRTRTSWNGRRRIMAAGLLVLLIGGAAFELNRGFLNPGPTSTTIGGAAPRKEPPVEPPRSDQSVTSPDAVSPMPVEEAPGRPAAQVIAPADTRTESRGHETSVPRRAADAAERPAIEPRGDSSKSSPATESLEALRRTFDALVMTSPSYQLDSRQATPEAVAALRDSKRLLLPALATRDVSRAREALERGDADRALSEVAGAAAMLEDHDFGPVDPGLRETVRQLLTQARAAKASEENRVYTTSDVAIVPPLPLGRQLPATGPPGLPSDLVGHLELLIGRNGEVEAVKLHTPLNRYHERMIVSAAKAWRYQPARKDGKSVRFRLIRSVTLPED